MTTSTRACALLPLVLLLAGCALFLGGCGGPAESPDATMASLDAPSPDDASASPDAASPADDAPAADAPATPEDAPRTEDAPALDASHAVDARALDAPGLDAPGAVRLELVDPYAYGNCFGGPPDPLLAFWTLRATGPVGERVTVDSARLAVQVAARGYSETQELTLDVASFVIPAGGTIDQMQRKESGTPSIPICTFCSDTVAGELQLEVTTSAGTERVTQILDGVGCVF